MIGWAEKHLGANRAVLAISLARMGDGVGNSVLLVTLPLYVAEVPSPWALPTPVLVGILISAFGLVSSAVQPLAGAWVDRFGRRKAAILAGLGLMALCTLAFLGTGSYTSLALLRVAQGIGFAVTLPASLAILKSGTEPHTRGGAMGVFTTFRMIGFAAGPLLGGFLQSRYGFAAAFVGATVAILVGMAAVQLWVREPEDTPGPEARFEVFDRSWLEPGLLPLGFATFVMASNVAMMTALENGFNERLGQTALGFGVAFSALPLTRVLLQAPLGRLSDHVGRKPLVLAGLLLLAPATVALGHAATTLQLTAVRLVQGLATAAIAAPAFALAADLAAAGREARQMSLLTTGFALGIAVGPLLAGLLAVHSFELPFWFGGALTLVVTAVVWRAAPETVRRT